MLAELAAANAAFAIIKQVVTNGGELIQAAEHVSTWFDTKATLQKEVNNAAAKGDERKSDLEEFLALEKLREQEAELKQLMIYHGRAGMWSDWQAFQAEQARKRVEARRAEERKIAIKRVRRQELFEYLFAVVIVTTVVAGCVWLTMVILEQKGYR